MLVDASGIHCGRFGSCSDCGVVVELKRTEMTTTKQPPAAVRRYMAEYEETEQDVCDYILGQLSYYVEITDKANTTEEQWIAFKMGCTSGQAKTAIRWAKGEK